MSVAPVSTRVMNLAALLTQTARRLGPDLALVWGDLRLSWAELEARACACAAGLRALGVGKGDRVLVHSSNNTEMIEAMFACWRLGAVWVPANYRLAPAELAGLAETAGPKVLLVHAGFPEHARACAGMVDATVTIGGDGENDHDAFVSAHMGAAPDPVAVDRDDPAWFFFTSGTTGRPKAAVLTHGQMAFVLTNHMCDLMPDSGPEDASLVVAPLSHGAGVHLLGQVAKGVKTVLPPGTGFDPAVIWQLVQDWRITNAFTVPTIVKRLVEHPAVDTLDHSSLRYVIYAGAPMYRADQIRALEKLGPVLVQYFGLGEVTGNITVLPPVHHSTDDSQMRLGTCGFARTGMEVQVQDDAGRVLGPGETGEICVIGPAVFAGYFDNPEANAKSFRNGWFRTGDLGHMDAEGFVYLTGRASDMFISGGSNIYPREIEEAILRLPAVSECAVLGVPDAEWGEVGLAVVVPAPGATVAPDAVRAAIAPQLARYKLPKTVVVWEELPKSGYGKITRKLIRAELERRGQWPGTGGAA